MGCVRNVRSPLKPFIPMTKNLQKKLHETRAEQIRIEMEIEDLKDAGYAFEKVTDIKKFNVFTVLKNNVILFEWHDVSGLNAASPRTDFLAGEPEIICEIYRRMLECDMDWRYTESVVFNYPKDVRADEFGIEWKSI